MSLFQKNLEEHLCLFKKISILDKKIQKAIQLIVDSMDKGHKLLLCGNGGSAADCQHIAAEFTGRFIQNRKPLAAIALTTDSSALTCIANDYSYEDVFSRQVLALGCQGDVLIAISTSGNSENIARAVWAATSLNMPTICLSGCDGGSLSDMCDISIVVPSTSTARIQEAHILIGHTLCGGVEQQLGLADTLTN